MSEIIDVESEEELDAVLLQPLPTEGDMTLHDKAEFLPAVLHETDKSLSLQQAKDLAQFKRDMTVAVLNRETDYAVIPGTGKKPSLLKPGAEFLLQTFNYGHHFERVEIDRDDKGHPFGVTYRCFVHLKGEPEATVASCDGYCGRDDAGKAKAPWNTIVKMSQKRALVGACLQATGMSGAFTQDLEDMNVGGSDSVGNDRSERTSARPASDEGGAPSQGSVAPPSPISDKQVRLVAYKANDACLNDDQRHAMIALVTKGRTRSAKEMFSREVDVLLRGFEAAADSKVTFAGSGDEMVAEKVG